MILEGLLLVDKAKDWTSHDAVAITRRLFIKGTKVGHAGTLDPMATGLLILLIGRATRTSESMLKLSKIYKGTARLGVETETEDMEGTVTREAAVPSKSAEELQAIFDRFHGEVEMPVQGGPSLK